MTFAKLKKKKCYSKMMLVRMINIHTKDINRPPFILIFNKGPIELQNVIHNFLMTPRVGKALLDATRVLF